MSKKAILVVVLLAASLAGTALAGVNMNINIGVPLPQVVVAAPPEMAVIPGTYVYIATDVNADLMFYQNNWYRPHNGRWFVSLNYNGPWRTAAAPPVALRRLPQNYRDYRNVPPGRERMPYGQVRDNWRTWERDRHWDQARERDRHWDQSRERDRRWDQSRERDRHLDQTREHDRHLDQARERDREDGNGHHKTYEKKKQRDDDRDDHDDHDGGKGRHERDR